MIFRIEFENSSIGVLDTPNIESFSFTCSMFKTYSIAKLVLKDITRVLFNRIRSGMDVLVSLSSKDGKDMYDNHMKVLSFSKSPSNDGNVDYMEMTLISSMYFDKSLNTECHEGSIGEIIANIMNRNFKDSVYKFEGTKTDDRPRRRYQTSERTSDFMIRILKYGYKEKLPIYLYHDAKGVLNLKGVSELMKESPRYETHGALNDRLNLSSVDETNNSIPFWSFQSNYSGKTACSRIDSIFTTKNFTNTSNEVVDSYSFSSSENSNNMVDDLTPPKTVFYNWNIAPTDAFGMASRESFNLTCSTCSFSAVFRGFAVDEMNIGSTINVNLPYEPTATNSSGESSNLAEGRYLVTDTTFTYSNNTYVTKSNLIQASC